MDPTSKSLKPDDAAGDKRYVVDLSNLVPLYPTHRHSPMFWEALGRTVATFGFLERSAGQSNLRLYRDKTVPRKRSSNCI
jgi:hypothetical protein